MGLTGIYGALYYRPALDGSQAAETVRAAARALGEHEGEAFRPFTDPDREALEGTGPGVRRVNLTHAGVARAIDSPFWLMPVRLVDYADPGRTTLIDVAPMVVSLERAAVAPVWGLTRGAMERMAAATTPTAAFANGMDDRGDEDVPPAAGLGDGLPSWFTPWTYLGADRLTDEVREWLRALPAHRSEPLGGGWVVEAVPDLFSRPDAAFADALAAAPGGPVRYRQAGKK